MKARLMTGSAVASVASAAVETIRGFNTTKGWIDRDGVTMSAGPYLVIGIDECLRRWKDNQAFYIHEKPLPDPKALNDAIPKSEWEMGLDNRPRPPWEHTVCVGLVDPETGETYSYMHGTAGAHYAYDELRERTIVMRELRGANVKPIVELSTKPMKTQYGQTTRPHFKIVGWKYSGGDPAIAGNGGSPQLTGPVAVTPPTTEAPTAAAAAAPKSGKPSINLGAKKDALDTLLDVEPVTSEEVLNDSIPW
jgi:hypothetical protein